MNFTFLLRLNCLIPLLWLKGFKSLYNQSNTVKIENPVVEKIMKSRHMTHQGILCEMNLFPFMKDNLYQPRQAALWQFFSARCLVLLSLMRP